MAIDTTDKLLQVLQAAPEGVALTGLAAMLPAVPRRTLQRQLARLVQDGTVAATGEGRARRYALSEVSQVHPVASFGIGAFPIDIPLSQDSMDVLGYVERPLSQRKPVGWQRDFLAEYQPNRSFYLPAPMRRQLRLMGQTGQGDTPMGTYSRAILNRLLIDLSWASSHLEGNTYTRLDTRTLIEKGKAAAGKGTRETQMILNHKTAIELLVENIETVGFNRHTLFNLHSALSENLMPNPADEGRIRQHPVEISQSVYRPLSTPQQIEDALTMVLQKAGRIKDPFEQSFFTMVHLPYLQPFADVNKRTSRLMANLPLFCANLCPMTFLDVSEGAYSLAVLGVYELTRIELLRDLYLWAYERSTQEYLAIRQDLAEPDPLRLAYREFIKRQVREVVSSPQADALKLIAASVEKAVPAGERDSVKALVIDELRRLHEGSLARYGLLPSQLHAWKARQGVRAA